YGYNKDRHSNDLASRNLGIQLTAKCHIKYLGMLHPASWYLGGYI
ncbi:1093_t:CDS:1, partial [Diversispora eburnea]